MRQYKSKRVRTIVTRKRNQKFWREGGCCDCIFSLSISQRIDIVGYSTGGKASGSKERFDSMIVNRSMWKFSQHLFDKYDFARSRSFAIHIYRIGLDQSRTQSSKYLQSNSIIGKGPNRGDRERFKPLSNVNAESSNRS